MFDDVLKLMDPKEKKFVIDKLKIFQTDQSDDRSLRKAAKDPEILRLEKKYVPQKKHNKKHTSNISCFTLISTVGFSEQPVILTILCLQPKKVLLLHTKKTRKKAEKVRDDEDVQGLELKPNV